MRIFREMRLLSGLIGCLSVFVFCSGFDQAPGPRAVPIEPNHDFGTVKQGQKLVHKFTVKNEGSSALFIARADLSQPGMKVQFAGIVPPGGTGTVEVEWNTASLQGDFEAEAALHTNDPSQPKVRLQLKATVQAPIEFQPLPQIYFSAYRDETTEKKVRIINNEARPLEITKVEPGSDHYEARLEKVLPGFIYDLYVKLRPGIALGRYVDEPIYLHTNHPERSRLLVLANLFVKPDFYAFPEELSFGAVSAEALRKQPRLVELSKQSVSLSNRRGPVEILQIDTDVPGLAITRNPATGKSEKFRLDIALVVEKLQKGKIAGNIRILTTDPKAPELLIPVSGEVK